MGFRPWLPVFFFGLVVLQTLPALGGSARSRARRLSHRVSTLGVEAEAPKAAAVRPCPRELADLEENSGSTAPFSATVGDSETMRLFREYLRANTPSIGNVGEVKQVGSIGDAIFVQQDGVLKLVRMASLRGETSQVAPLDGDQVEWSQKIGHFYWIRTSVNAGRRAERSHYLTVLGADLEVAESPLRLSPQAVLEVTELSKPDATAIKLGNHLWTVTRYEPQLLALSRAVRSGGSVLYLQTADHPIVEFKELPGGAFLEYSMQPDRRYAPEKGWFSIAPLAFEQTRYQANLNGSGDLELPYATPVPSLDASFLRLVGMSDEPRTVSISAGYLDPTHEKGKATTIAVSTSLTKDTDERWGYKVEASPKRGGLVPYQVHGTEKGILRSNTVALFPTKKLAAELSATKAPGAKPIFPEILKSAYIRDVAGTVADSPLMVIEQYGSTKDEILAMDGQSHTLFTEPVTYHFFYTPPAGGAEKSAMSLTTKHPLRDFTTRHEKLGQIGRQFLFAKMYDVDGVGTADALIDLRHGMIFFIREIDEVRKLESPDGHYLIFKSALETGSKYVGVLDLKREGLLKFDVGVGADDREKRVEASPFARLGAGLTYQFLGPTSPFLLERNTYFAGEVELKGELKNWAVHSDRQTHLTRLQAPWLKDETRPSEFWISASTGAVFALDGTQDIAIADKTPPGVRSPNLPVRMVQAHARPLIQESQRETVRNRVVLVFQDGSARSFHLSGAVGQVDYIYEENLERIEGEFESLTTASTLKSRFTWLPKQQGALYEFPFLRPEPAYRDDEITVTVGDPVLNQATGVYYRNKSMRVAKPIELSVDHETKKDDFRRFMKLLFGEKNTSLERNPVDSVERSKDWLFIRTKKTGDSPARTYFWSISRETVLFALPNYEQSLVFEGKRFFVSQASARTDAIVAVVDEGSGQLLNYFNLKKLKLDFRHPDFVVFLPAEKRIGFRAVDGSYRYYDETKDAFLGLLPEDIRTEVDRLAEENLGSCLNDQIFSRTSDPFFGRQNELRQLGELVFPRSQDDLPQVLVVSESGAGSTHLLRTFEDRYIHGHYDRSSDRRVVFFDVDLRSIMAGTMYRGTFVDKFVVLRDVAAKLARKGYQLILVMENAHGVAPGPHNFGEGSPHEQIGKLMEDKVLTVLATTTPAGAEQLAQQHGKSFFGLFRSRLDMSPMSLEQTAEAVVHVAESWGKSVEVNQPGLIGILKSLRRFAHGAMPKPAMDLVRNLIQKDRSGSFTRADFLSSLATQSGVPAGLLDRERLPAYLADLRRRIVDRLKGRDDIVDDFLNALRSFALGLRRPDWPIYRALINGFTGVGKTEFARVLAEVLLPNPKALLKIDCSDYQSPLQAVDLKKIVVKHLRTYPFNIILFDEMEKMSADVRNIFLSLGEGDFTDEHGNPLSSSLSIQIATSNAGTEEAIAQVRKWRSTRPGFGGTVTFSEADFGDLTGDEKYKVAKILETALERDFTGPFRNRFDYHYSALPISVKHAEEITESYLENIRYRMVEQDIQIKFAPEIRDFLVRRCISWELGGRRLAIGIESLLTDGFLSAQMLSGNIAPGREYEIYLRDEQLAVRPAADQNR